MEPREPLRRAQEEVGIQIQLRRIDWERLRLTQPLTSWKSSSIPTVLSAQTTGFEWKATSRGSGDSKEGSRRPIPIQSLGLEDRETDSPTDVRK